MDWEMKLALAVTFLLVQYHQSDAFLSKLGGIGAAMKAFSSALFLKSSDPTPAGPGAGAEEGDLMQQIEFMNSMMKRVHTMFENPSSAFLQKIKPMTAMMCDFVIPNFDHLNFPEDVLRAKYNYSPEQIKKYKLLFLDTRKMLHDINESANSGKW